jgi:hypothetical protein
MATENQQLRLLVTAFILGGAGCPENVSQQRTAIASAKAIAAQLFSSLDYDTAVDAFAAAKNAELQAQLDAIRADLDKATRPAAAKGAK